MGPAESLPQQFKRQRAWYTLLQTSLSGNGVVCSDILDKDSNLSPLQTYMTETCMNGTVYEHAPSTDLAVRIIKQDKDRPYILDHFYILDKLRDADAQIKLAEQIRLAELRKKMPTGSNRKRARIQM